MVAKKLFYLAAATIVSAFLWFINAEYPSLYFEKAFDTFAALAITYLLFKVIFEEAFVKRIRESRMRYSFRKAVSILYLVVLSVVLIRVWIGTPETLLVSFGLIGAGVAIALQDVFKNFAGGALIFLTGVYRVGDRIEIGSKYGDVMDVGVFYTTLMEIRGWVSGDQATGRLLMIPNGQVISTTVNNYTKDHNFMWDELTIPVTYDSNWKEAVTRILRIVETETRSFTLQAEAEISRIEEKYYLSKRMIEPAIYLTLTDNWITFNIRYVTDVRERRFWNDKLSRMILEEIEKSKDIRIASATLDIIGLPKDTTRGPATPINRKRSP